MRKALFALNIAPALVLAAATAHAQHTVKIGLICPYSGLDRIFDVLDFVEPRMPK